MTNKNLVIALIIAVLAAVVLLMVQLRKSDRGEETARIDPAVEREIVERDRAILKTGIAAAFPEWVRKWRTGGKDFDPAVLQQDGIEATDPIFDIQEDEVRIPTDDEELRPLISPDGSRYIEYSGDGEAAEPDSELTLVDAATKERRRLLFYGPSVRIDNAAWADNDTVIAVGSEEVEGGSRPGVVQPLVWIFHLQQRVTATYAPAK
jgi:hypothetical protein